MTIDKTVTKYIAEGFASIDNPTSDAEMVRSALQAELDAINFYEQMAAKAKDPAVRELFLDVAYEEKVHVGEFRAMLEELDGDQEIADEEGAEEFGSDD